MRKGIQETDKSFVFYRQICKTPVTVSLRCGWIWIEEKREVAGFMFPKRKLFRETYTTEDARNLIAAIQELIPAEETQTKEDGKL